MKILNNIESYRKLFLFIVKYWNSEIVEYSNRSLDGLSSESNSKEYQENAKQFVEDVKDMGPTFIKLGQLLSTRPDLLPKEYLDELKNLQDNVDPFPYEEVEKIIEDEIGVKISKAFSNFSKEPIASASLGQVHVAELRSGKKVAVKIQRPGISDVIKTELETLQEIAEYADSHSETARSYNIKNLIDEVSHSLTNELDYVKEANNLKVLSENLQEFEHIHIPDYIPDYSSSKVLTMEFIDGIKVTEIHPLRRIENDLDPVVEELVKAYLKQVIEDGIAHSDPHPGNVHITSDNEVILMDLGMIARFNKSTRETFLQVMNSLSMADSDELCRLLLEISEYDRNESDISSFKRTISYLVQENYDRPAKELQTGQLILQMKKVAAHNGIIIPVEFDILGKILLNLDQIIAVLSPEYNANDTIKSYLQTLVQRKMREDASPQNVLSTLLQTKKLAEELPEQLNTILSKLSTDQFKIKVEAIDEKRFSDAFQKVANRITLGIIVASLVIGAALMMDISTSWNIMGYPALAIILFMIAVVIGLVVIYQLIFKNETLKK